MHLESAYLGAANLSGAGLSAAHMNADTTLAGARLDARTRLANIVWNGVSVTCLNWEAVYRLGDEYWAWQPREQGETGQGEPKDKDTRLQELQDAVMANRQVATLLRSQGLNEHTDRFAYRAQVCQRRVFRGKHQWSGWVLQTLLAMLAGYGFRLWRIFAAYLVVLAVFAALYFVLGLPNRTTHPR